MADNNGVRRRVFSVLMDDEPGALARVAGVLTGRGYNIDGLTVARIPRLNSEDQRLARMTIVVLASDTMAVQVAAQMQRMVNTHTVEDLTDNPHRVEAEITLIKLVTSLDTKQRAAIQMAESGFRARAILVEAEFVIFDHRGFKGSAQAFAEAMSRYGEIEVACSGPVAIA